MSRDDDIDQVLAESRSRREREEKRGRSVARESSLKRERRIATLEAQVRDLTRERDAQDQTIAEQRQLLDEAATVLEQTPDTEELASELENLHGLIREGTYRAAWDDAATAAGVDPERLDDLWKLAGPEIPEDGDPDPKAIGKQLQAALKGREAWVTSPDRGDDQGDDQADEPAEQADEADEYGEGSLRGLFRIAPPAPAGKPAAGKPAAPAPAGKPPGGRQDASAAAAPAGKPAAPAKLRPGPGGGRGGRADLGQTQSAVERVNSDFAASGRTHDYKI